MSMYTSASRHPLDLAVGGTHDDKRCWACVHPGECRPGRARMMACAWPAHLKNSGG